MFLFKVSLALILLVIFSVAVGAIAGNHNHNHNGSSLNGIKFPDQLSFSADSSSATSDCSLAALNKDRKSESDDDDDEEQGLNVASVLSLEPHEQVVKLHLNRRVESEPKKSVISSTIRDSSRIQTLYKRITEKKNQSNVSRLKKKENMNSGKQADERTSPVAAAPAPSESYAGQLMATLESGVGFGSGEYFMDVFIGTPPKHFSLILDTGSDLNWIQCVPCLDCFEQNGPYYDPKDSTSFRNITCRDPRCQLVSSPDPPLPCKSETQSCPYYYWYGDSSNTTGDFAVETFTVNLTASGPMGKAEFRRVENIMFGCGHWNRGLFKGAAGLLGLGRGPLSFSSQLQSLYGHSFSYCLVDRNSDTNVSSKLIFGEDKGLLSHLELNFTALVAGKENPVDTFYYIEIKSILVGGEVLKIPEQTWKLSPEGYGGTIIDSGTTLSYFQDPAYQVIKEAFLKKVKGYQLAKIEDFPLDLCYNVSGADSIELPDFGILFSDGGVWNFPVQNYFIQVDPQEVVCLAFKNTSASALSIIGNYQQQNFHILYDTKNSRLGYAPMNCADV